MVECLNPSLLSIPFQNFTLDICESGFFSHKLEGAKPEEDILKLPCASLRDYFPFVTHTKMAAEGGVVCKEELTLRGVVIDTFMRGATDIPIC